MTLANMRANGVHTLAVWCGGRGCHHHSVLDVSGYGDDLPVPSFGPRLRCERCGHLGCRRAAELERDAQARADHSGEQVTRESDLPPTPDIRLMSWHVRFSNRPVGVKRFQTIHRYSVDVAHGLVLLFGIGTKALPSWDSKMRWNNLWGGLAVS
jgi:hypothetical protein